MKPFRPFEFFPSGKEVEDILASKSAVFLRLLGGQHDVTVKNTKNPDPQGSLGFAGPMVEVVALACRPIPSDRL